MQKVRFEVDLEIELYHTEDDPYVNYYGETEVESVALLNPKKVIEEINSLGRDGILDLLDDYKGG